MPSTEEIFEGILSFKISYPGLPDNFVQCRNRVDPKFSQFKKNFELLANNEIFEEEKSC